MDHICIRQRSRHIKTKLDFEGESCFVKQNEKVEENHITKNNNSKSSKVWQSQMKQHQRKLRNKRSYKQKQRRANHNHYIQNFKREGSSQNFMVPKSATRGINVYFMFIYFLGIVFDIEQWNANTLEGNKD